MLPILLYLVGVLVGALIGVLADQIPRSSGRRGGRRRQVTSAPRFVATWQLLARPAFRRRLRHGDAAAWEAFATEQAEGLLLALLSFQDGSPLALFLHGLLISFLLLVALIDLRYRKVLNILIVPAGVVTILIRVAAWDQTAAYIVGGAVAFGLFFAVALLRPHGLGGGDIKLAAFLGLVFGYPYVIWVLLVGIFSGGIASIVLIVALRRTSTHKIAYAPFLCFGALVALFVNPLPRLLGAG